MENLQKKISGDLSPSKSKLFCAITGAVAGFINGLFGGGGGMIVVPMLMWLLGYSERESHATAILIILPMSVISGLFYAFFGTLELGVCIPVTLGVAIGGTLGAFALKKLSNKWLGVIFSLVMVFAGVKLLFF